jgi:hypothetical protein
VKYLAITLQPRPASIWLILAGLGGLGGCLRFATALSIALNWAARGRLPGSVAHAQPVRFASTVVSRGPLKPAHWRPHARTTGECRVRMWRGGLRFSLSAPAPFVWRCLTSRNNHSVSTSTGSVGAVTRSRRPGESPEGLQGRFLGPLCFAKLRGDRGAQRSAYGQAQTKGAVAEDGLRMPHPSSLFRLHSCC